MVKSNSLKKANRKKKRKKDSNIQVIYSEKRKILVERYLSPKGKYLVNNGTLTKEEADKKYGKNRYRINPNAKTVKTIKHFK